MKTVIDYKIITTTMRPRLIKKVVKAIQEGWQPFGPPYTYRDEVAVNSYDFENATFHSQAMVKYLE